MTFLAPWLAGFALCAAVPIVIHLLLRRFRPVRWPAMRLLRLVQQTTRRLNLRDLILMCLRALALAAIALAMSRPTASPRLVLGRDAAPTVVVVLDRSLSMSWRTGGTTRFAEAVAKARLAIESLPKDAQVALLAVDDGVMPVVPSPTRDLAFVISELAAVTPSGGGSDLGVGIDAAWRILEQAQSPTREILVVSDFQARAWPAADDPRLASLSQAVTAAGVACPINLVDAGGGGDDVAVESLALTGGIALVDSESAVVATLRNHGSQPVQDLHVALRVLAPGDAADAEPRTAAETVVDRLEPGALREVALSVRFATAGEHRMAVAITPDRLPGDDTRHLVVEVAPRLGVLLVEGRPGDGLDGSAGFLQMALSPPDPEGGLPPFTCERIAIGQLAGRPLTDVRVIALADVPAATPDLADLLATWVQSGGGLLMLPGPSFEADAWNRELGERLALLPVRYGARADLGNGGLGFATEKLAHPVVAMFADSAGQHFLARPRITVRQPMHLLPGEGNAIVARFSDGEPAIAERRVGAGVVLAFAVGADRAWSDLPVRPAYLPLMMRSAQHVARGNRPPASLIAGETAVDILPQAMGGGSSRLTPPAGKTVEIAPVAGTGGLLTVRSAPLAVPGFYRLDHAAVEAPGRWYAVNPPAGEGDLSPLSTDELRRRQGGLDVTWIGADADLRAALAKGRTGTELWPVLVALAAACLLLESALLWRWGRAESGR